MHTFFMSGRFSTSPFGTRQFMIKPSKLYGAPLERSCLDNSCIWQCLHVDDPSPLGWPFQFHYFHLTTSNLIIIIIIFQQVRKCTVHLIWSLDSSKPSKNLVIQIQPSLNKTSHYHSSCTNCIRPLCPPKRPQDCFHWLLAVFHVYDLLLSQPFQFQFSPQNI